MIQFFQRLFKNLVGFSNQNRSINIYKTLLFNFRAFGIKGVLKLPVFVYSNTNIYRVGKILIDCPWEKGLVKIGFIDFKSQGVTKFCNQGCIRISGNLEIGGCTILENCGQIIFKGSCLVADGCLVNIKSKLEIGENSAIGFHSMIMDSDDHFSFDVENRQVHRFAKPIIIGKNNWFGCHTFIKKGTVTPDYLIVASANALLCKDYSSLPPYSVLGGSPAKLIKSGIRCIFNYKNEAMIIDFFRKNLQENVYNIDKNVNLDEFCALN